MLRTPHLLLIILAAVIAQPLRAQNLDSLLHVWNDNAQPDSNRVNAYKDYIRFGYIVSDPDTAVIMISALQEYAKMHKYPNANAVAHSLQGLVDQFKGDFPAAAENYKRSLSIFQEIGDKRGVANSLNNIGLIYNNQGNYPMAMEYYEKSLAIKQEIGDTKGTANTQMNIGIIYKSLGNYSRALEYYQKSMLLFEKLSDKKGLAISMTNIGTIYFEQANYTRALEYAQKSMAMFEALNDKNGFSNSLNNIGRIYDKQGNYTLALEYYERSLEIREEIGFKQGVASSLHSLGVIYENLDNELRAMEYFMNSLSLREELGDKYGIANSLNSIGALYQKQGKANRALDYCQKGLAVAEEIGSWEEQKSACQCLYDTYKEMGKGNEALIYIEKMRVVEDSMNAQETTKKLEQMEFAKVMLQDSIAKAEEVRQMQEAHLSEVRKKNQTRNVLIGASIFLVLLAIGLYSRWRFMRRSRDIISKEKDRSEHLLLNILPAEIAQELKEKGRAEARDFEMVSILFSDFKGFTEASSRLSAAELVQEINHCFEGFDAIMVKYGIEKIKTIGDAYMAAGGLPVPTEGSVKNTVLAALEMQRFIEQRKAQNEAEGKPAFEMRVGIHTGPVVAGIVGVKKFQYDIWGDTVNTASRLETNSEAGKVNISQSTYELIKNDPEFTFESRGNIDVKGKGEIEMWFVTLRSAE